MDNSGGTRRQRGEPSAPYAGSSSSSSSWSSSERPAKRSRWDPNPSISNPVRFVSEGRGADPRPDAATAQKLTAAAAAVDGIGQFEAHTRGFGSRLMAKMGYVPGQGLGKHQQGIPVPIMPEHQTDKLGMGYSATAANNAAAGWGTWESATRGSARNKKRAIKNFEAAEGTEEDALFDGVRREWKKAKALVESMDRSWGATVEEEKRRFEAMEEIILALNEAKEKQASGKQTMESLIAMFAELKGKFGEEYRMCNLASVARSLAYPLLIELFWGWVPMEDPLHGLDTMSSLKALLSRGDRPAAASPYDELVGEVVLPVVTEWGTNSWQARDPQPMIAFLELWDVLLPRPSYNLILSEVVMTKLMLAVESWDPDPRHETVLIHSWVHPWMPLLGGKLEALYETIQMKMRGFLSSWEAQDGYAFELIYPWRDVFDSGSWERLVLTHIVPKLKTELKDLKIDPHAQKAGQLSYIMKWESAIPHQHMVALLKEGLFRKWLKALKRWLRAEHNLNKVRDWYEGWKTCFSPALLADEHIQILLCTGLSMITKKEISLGRPESSCSRNDI